MPVIKILELMLNGLIGLNQQKRNLIMHFFAGILHPCHILHQGRYRNCFVTMPLLKPRSSSEWCVFNTHLSHVSGHIYMYKGATTVATICGHLQHICTNIIFSPNWHPICYCKHSADCWWLTVIIFLGLLGGKTINSADVRQRGIFNLQRPGTQHS